jgi:hypothetical protein
MSLLVKATRTLWEQYFQDAFEISESFRANRLSMASGPSLIFIDQRPAELKNKPGERPLALLRSQDIAPRMLEAHFQLEEIQRSLGVDSQKIQHPLGRKAMPVFTEECFHGRRSASFRNTFRAYGPRLLKGSRSRNMGCVFTAV